MRWCKVVIAGGVLDHDGKIEPDILYITAQTFKQGKREYLVFPGR